MGKGRFTEDILRSKDAIRWLKKPMIDLFLLCIVGVSIIAFSLLDCYAISKFTSRLEKGPQAFLFKLFTVK